VARLREGEERRGSTPSSPTEDATRNQNETMCVDLLA